jgi:hypothetical protein
VRDTSGAAQTSGLGCADLHFLERELVRRLCRWEVILYLAISCIRGLCEEPTGRESTGVWFLFVLCYFFLSEKCPEGGNAPRLPGFTSNWA